MAGDRERPDAARVLDEIPDEVGGQPLARGETLRDVGVVVSVGVSGLEDDHRGAEPEQQERPHEHGEPASGAQRREFRRLSFRRWRA